MPSAVDTDFLSLLLNPTGVKPPNDPSTGKPVTQVEERIKQFIEDLDKSKDRLVIPAPVVAELLVISGAPGPDYLAHIDSQAAFTVAPFDQLAAVEAAEMTRRALAEGNKKAGSTQPWPCVKVDRQIVAVAKAIGLKRIYSNDEGVLRLAALYGIEGVHLANLPLPPPAPPLLVMMENAGPEVERLQNSTAAEPLPGVALPPSPAPGPPAPSPPANPKSGT